MNALREAAENLPGHWYRDNYGDGKGNFCAAGHVMAAKGYSLEEIRRNGDPEGTVVEVELMNKIAAEQFPDRGLYISTVNDHPDTTEADMVMILEKAAAEYDAIV